MSEGSREWMDLLILGAERKRHSRLERRICKALNYWRAKLAESARFDRPRKTNQDDQ